MVSENRRSESLRPSTLDLLRAGEQPHIEFKSEVVVGAVAKQVAAGANFVAFQPAAEVHTIVYGISEEDLGDSGVSTGAIVGLFSDGGGPADLDSLQLQVEQAVHSKVRPQPNISFYQENVATTPILVVEVRPTSAPHIVDERWPMRGVGGVRAMTQAEALQIFKNQRLAAWIDEFAESDPLKRALAAILGSIDDLRFSSYSGADGFEGSSAARLQALEGSLGEIDARVGEAIDVMEDARKQATFAAENTSTESAEEAWWSVMNTRMMRMHTVHSFASQIGAARMHLVDSLVSDHLGETAQFTAYAENLAESAAYRSPRRAGLELRSELAAVSDLISASLWRRNGLPPRFGFDWLDEVKNTRDLLDEMGTPLKDTNWVRGVEIEVGLLDLPNVSVQRVVEASRGSLSLNERIVSCRTGTGVYRLAVPISGSTWAAVFAPGTEVDADATMDLATMVGEIRALVAESGGSSWCVEGPGLAIPTS